MDKDCKIHSIQWVNKKSCMCYFCQKWDHTSSTYPLREAFEMDEEESKKITEIGDQDIEDDRQRNKDDDLTVNPLLGSRYVQSKQRKLKIKANQLSWYEDEQPRPVPQMN